MSEHEKPTLYIIAGPNGSGKSSMYEILTKTDPVFAKAQFVNPDVYGEKLANKEGAKTVNELSPERRAAVDVKAGKIAVTVRNTLLENGKSFAVETTASSKGVLRLMDTAKEHGYNIDLKYVTLKSSALNIQRVSDRVQQGGHSVDDDVIVRRYDKAEKLLPSVLAKADHAELYDNSKVNLLVLSKDQNKIKVAPTAELAGWSKERVSALVNAMKKEAPDLKLDRGRSVGPER